MNEHPLQRTANFYERASTAAPRATVAIHCQLVVVIVDVAALGALVGSLIESLVGITVGVGVLLAGVLVGVSDGEDVGGNVSPGAKQHMSASGWMALSHSAAVATKGA
jgi:hypothetical protein